MRRENGCACLFPVILRCPRQRVRPEVAGPMTSSARASKDAAEALWPSSFEARRHGEVPGVVLRGSLRSHLRM